MSYPFHRKDDWRPRSLCALTQCGFQVGHGGRSLATPPATGGGGGAFVEDLTIVNSGGTLTNEQINVGLITFQDGEILAGSIPQIRKAGVAVGGQQIDQETYYASGALRECTLHFDDTLVTGDNDYEIYSVTGTQSHTAGITWAEVLALDGGGFNWTWRIEDQNGDFWEADMRTAGNGGTINGQDMSGPSNYGFFSRGPHECTWSVAMPFVRTSDSADHYILRGEFHVYAKKTAGGTLLECLVEPLIKNGSKSLRNGSFLIRNVWLMKNGQTTSTAAWKREVVAPAATLTVSAASPLSPSNDWTILTSAGVLSNLYRSRVLVVPGKGAMLIKNYTNTTTMTGYTPTSTQSICSNEGRTGSGALNMGGVLVVSGTAYMQAIGGKFQRVCISSANDLSGVTFTISGTLSTGANTEVIAGPTAGSFVLLTKDWETITGVSVSGTVSGVHVGYGGFSTASTTASGSWEIYGTFLPMGSWLSVGLLKYSTGAPQLWFPKYDPARLAASPALPHWDFAKTGSLASQATLKTTYLNDMANAGAFGNTVDYNPHYYDWVTGGNRMNHTLYEPTSGEHIGELSTMGSWAAIHAQQQTAASWRILTDMENGTFTFPRHVADNVTGNALIPGDYPTFLLSNVLTWSIGTDGDYGLTNYQAFVPDIAHRGDWSSAGYIWTRRLSMLQACQYGAVYNWLVANGGSGYAKNYPALFVQTRAVMWAVRDFLNACANTPDTLYNSVVTPKSAMQALVDGWGQALYQLMVIPGPDNDGNYSDAVANTPTKGDFHFLNVSDAPNWQLCGYGLSTLAIGSRRVTLDSNMLGMWKWLADLQVNLLTKTASVNPAYMQLDWFRCADASNNPHTLAQAWTWAQTPANWGLSSNILVYGVSGTLTPTAGNLTTPASSVTLSCSTPRFFSDHVGARIGKGTRTSLTGYARITAVNSSTEVVVTVESAFDSNAAFSSWVMGVPNAGANSRAVLQPYIGGGFDNQYITLGYAAAASASICPGVSGGAAALASLETWIANTVINGQFNWQNYYYQAQGL